jgi:hypothetical protein
MKAKQLADICRVSEQYIRAVTKEALDKNELYVKIGGVKYSYCLKTQGRGRPAYFYEKHEVKVVKKRIDSKHLNIQLDEKQKVKLDLKLKVMGEFTLWKQNKKGTVKEFIQYVCKHFDIKYTYRMHNLWEKAYKERGARGLIDTRGKEKGTTKLTLEQQRFLIRNFRAFGAGEINYTQLWEMLHKQEQETRGFDFMAWKKNEVPNICDRSVVQRFIANYYKKRVIEWTLITKGEDLNKSYNQPAMGKRAETYTAKNECWEIDSTPADVIIYHDGNQMRPDILAIKDCYSGRCVATLAVKSNSLAIIRLLWKAIDELGLPKMIIGDNGRDYVSEQFQGLLHNIGIKYRKATAYAGDEKGMVERNFRTIQHSYMRVLSGFIGHNVSHRQKIEQQTAKKHRTAKDEFGNVAKTQTASSELLSWEELDNKLQEAIFLWEIDKKRRKGTSPIELWNACIKDIEKLDYENFLVYAGGLIKRVVNKEGINFDGRRYVSTFIHKYRKQEVFVSENIDNMSEVFVFDSEGMFIGTCVDATISPMSKEEFMQTKKEFNREVAAIQKEIRGDKLSARSKSTIKDDLRRAKDEHKRGLKQSHVIHLDNKEIQEKSKIEKTLEFDDRATIIVDNFTPNQRDEALDSLYSAYAVD